MRRRRYHSVDPTKPSIERQRSGRGRGDSARYSSLTDPDACGWRIVDGGVWMERLEERLSGYCASSRQFVLFEYVSTGVLAGIGTIDLVLG